MLKKLATIIMMVLIGLTLLNVRGKPMLTEKQTKQVASEIADKINDYLEISDKWEFIQKSDEETSITYPLEGTLEVHFLDVGQADCTYITDGINHMLIDAGTEDQGTKIQAYLKKHGVVKLDYFIMTHPDADHIGSADVVLTKFDCAVSFVSNKKGDTKTAQRVMETAERFNRKIMVPNVGDTYSFGEGAFTILGPDREYDDTNESSICIKLDYGENSFLFTGDAGEEAEADLLKNWKDTLQSDVYKVGHHGSAQSSSEEFLDHVDPDYAVISCGKGNDYGHPHARILNILSEMGVDTYRTDEQGVIIAISDGKGITFDSPPSNTWKGGLKDDK